MEEVVYSLMNKHIKTKAFFQVRELDVRLEWMIHCQRSRVQDSKEARRLVFFCILI